MKIPYSESDNLPFLNTHSHTDLAIECTCTRDICEELHTREYSKGGYSVFEMEVTGKEGERASGRKKGRYLSMSVPEMKMPETAQKEKISAALSEIILDFLEKENIRIGRKTNILIAGIGNKSITADALGPFSAEKLIATSHLNKESKLFSSLGAPNISVIIPGVRSDTGIEAAKTVCAISDTVRAELIIAIDALCAREADRLCTTVQVSSSGIHPGSGIGNKRMALTREILGVPVMAIGIPTVISASTLICNALSLAKLQAPTPELERLLKENSDFFVSHGESDSLISLASDIISSAIEKALLPMLFQPNGR